MVIAHAFCPLSGIVLLARSLEFRQPAFQVTFIIGFRIVSIGAVYAKVIAQEEVCKDDVTALAVTLCESGAAIVSPDITFLTRHDTPSCTNELSTG
jgi:hypothetical protein